MAAAPWLTFVLPLATFMVVGMLEPTADQPWEAGGITIDDAAYPLVYIVKIVLTMVAIAIVWPGYRQFAGRVSPLAFLVGAAGAPLWIVLCKLHFEATLFENLHLSWLVEEGGRSAFNPWERWPDEPLMAWGFLAVRFWGLAAVVPVIEEFFLRGLAMRYFIAADWWKVPIGTLTPAAIAVGMLVPVLMHPMGELLAVVAWFSLVSWLVYKTRNIWDAVVAHMLTNLILGVWVVASGDWFLW